MPIINSMIFTGTKSRLQEKEAHKNGIIIKPDIDYDGMSKVYVNIKDIYTINTSRKVGNIVSQTWEEGDQITISDDTVVQYSLDQNDNKPLHKFEIIAPGLTSVVIENSEGLIKFAEYWIVEMNKGTYV
jgi:hypothetical protein